LNGILNEEIYIEQFELLKEFFNDNPDLTREFVYSQDKVIKLELPLYGLKQSGRSWQQKAKKELAKLGFSPLKSDSAIYRNEKTGVILASYMDDFLIF